MDEKRIKSNSLSYVRKPLLLFLLTISLFFVLLLVFCHLIRYGHDGGWVFFGLWIFFPVVFVVLSLVCIEKIGKPLLDLDKSICAIVEQDLAADGSHLDNLPNGDLWQLAVLLERWREEKARKTDEQSLNKQLELFALQSQINPHFLYNTLESIRGQALIDGMHDIALMTEALSTFFRYSISMKSSFVTLKDELNNVKNYVIIQQFRFENRFSLQITGDCDEQALDCIMPKLILQPIVENCIYHGLEPKVGKGKVTIWITYTKQRLRIKISDDGVGMNAQELEQLTQGLEVPMTASVEGTGKHSGIALTNVNQRIRLYYGNWYGLYVDSYPDIGTDVEIVLPVIRDFGRLEERAAAGGRSLLTWEGDEQM